jgi:hypothetical protein
LQGCSQWPRGLFLDDRIFWRRSKWTAAVYAIRFDEDKKVNLPRKKALICLYVAKNKCIFDIVPVVIGDAAN